MSCPTSSNDEPRQLLALLAAATTLSPNAIDGSSPTSASLGQSNGERTTAPIFPHNNTQLNAFLTREAKTEMVSMAASDAPIVIPSNPVNDHSTVSADLFVPLQNVVLSNTTPLQPSPMTSLSQSSSLECDRPMEQASIEVTIPAVPLFSTSNVRFNVDREGNTLSIPVEKSPEKNAEKNFFNYEEGYDTEDDIGPFWDAVMGEMEDDDDLMQLPERTDETRPEAEVIPAAAGEGPQPPESGDANTVTLTEEILKTMRNSELKAELKKRGLSQNGNKTVLTNRLLNNLQNPIIQEDAPERVPNGFAPTAKWRQLKPNSIPVEEPQRPPNMRGPTVPEGEEEFRKFNFPETFDRPPFTEMSSVYETDRKGRVIKNRQGKVQMKEEIRENGRANSAWLDKHKLTPSSLPSDWFEALLPLKRQPGDPASLVTIGDWTMLTNKKAMLANAGVPGGVYHDWKPFSPVEVRQFIALYILQGLSPSPQIKMKFQPHNEDPINGSNMCFKVFGRVGDRRHKMFKAFFTCQDPVKPIPTKKTHPNFKVDPFLAHIQSVSMEAWDMGRNISCDEQTIGFKGNHADKQRISYKKEGDGFLADTLCESGYTYTIYLRNMPPPKHYVDKGCSALHARVLFMFDQLKSKYHVCGLDNLYNSVKFCRDAFTGKNKVMVHGVARKHGRGVPNCTIQDEVANKNLQEQVRGTTKAAVLEGDSECPDVVAFSVYDTKPVNFLSTACTSLHWKEKTKKVFSKDAGVMILMRFLRPNITDDYNHGMNNVDQADQLRGTYRFDRWMRKRKWWWAIWMWGVQLLLVNAYVLYKTSHLLIWKADKSKILSQYDFRKSIVLAWFGIQEKENAEVDSEKSSENSRKRSRSTTTEFFLTLDEAGSSKHSARVTKQTLHPIDGALRVRLDENTE